MADTREGEGTVRTTNLKGAAKAEVASITGWSQVQVLPGPSFYTVKRSLQFPLFFALALVLPGPAAAKGYVWAARDSYQAGAALGLTAVVYSFDAAIQRSAARNYSKDGNRAAYAGEALGDGLFLLPALAVVHLTGRAVDSEYARNVGKYGLQGVIAASALTNVIKMLAHRHRPYTGDSRATWDGSSLSTDADDLSFPSGHTTAAFAAATAVAMELDHIRWVAPVAYGLAAAAGASRVYQHKHWGSDVVLGAAIGHFTTRALIRYNRRTSGTHTFLPELQTGPTDVRLTWRFE